MKQKVLRSVVSVVGIGALAAKHIWHVQVDAVTAGLLVLVVIPWLADLIKSVELTGLGKIEMQEIEAKATEAMGVARSATNKAELALANASRPASEVARVSEAADAVKAALECAAEYNRIRDTLDSGALRTTRMTEVVSSMIDIAKRLEHYDVAANLKESDRGKRLFSYAYLYTKPRSQFLEILLDSLIDVEDKPFGQYWGILALQRLIDVGSTADPSPSSLRRMLVLLGKLEQGTDRHYEMKKVLQGLGIKIPI